MISKQLRFDATSEQYDTVHGENKRDDWDMKVVVEDAFESFHMNSLQDARRAELREAVARNDEQISRLRESAEALMEATAMLNRSEQNLEITSVKQEHNAMIPAKAMSETESSLELLRTTYSHLQEMKQENEILREMITSRDSQLSYLRERNKVLEKDFADLKVIATNMHMQLSDIQKERAEWARKDLGDYRRWKSFVEFLNSKFDESSVPNKKSVMLLGPSAASGTSSSSVSSVLDLRRGLGVRLNRKSNMEVSSLDSADSLMHTAQQSISTWHDRYNALQKDFKDLQVQLQKKEQTILELAKMLVQHNHPSQQSPHQVSKQSTQIATLPDASRSSIKKDHLPATRLTPQRSSNTASNLLANASNTVPVLLPFPSLESILQWDWQQEVGEDLPEAYFSPSRTRQPSAITTPKQGGEIAARLDNTIAITTTSSPEPTKEKDIHIADENRENHAASRGISRSLSTTDNPERHTKAFLPSPEPRRHTDTSVAVPSNTLPTPATPTRSSPVHRMPHATRTPDPSRLVSPPDTIRVRTNTVQKLYNRIRALELLLLQKDPDQNPGHSTPASMYSTPVSSPSTSSTAFSSAASSVSSPSTSSRSPVASMIASTVLPRNIHSPSETDISNDSLAQHTPDLAKASNAQWPPSEPNAASTNASTAPTATPGTASNRPKRTFTAAVLRYGAPPCTTDTTKDELLEKTMVLTQHDAQTDAKNNGKNGTTEEMGWWTHEGPEQYLDSLLLSPTTPVRPHLGVGLGAYLEPLTQDSFLYAAGEDSGNGDGDADRDGVHCSGSGYGEALLEGGGGPLILGGNGPILSNSSMDLSPSPVLFDEWETGEVSESGAFARGSPVQSTAEQAEQNTGPEESLGQERIPLPLARRLFA